VRPGVVVSRGLWWGRHSPGGHGVNATTPQRLADMGGGATFFSNLVDVDRVEDRQVALDHTADGRCARDGSP
jgi:hypothetical protein